MESPSGTNYVSHASSHHSLPSATLYNVGCLHISFSSSHGLWHFPRKNEKTKKNWKKLVVRRRRRTTIIASLSMSRMFYLFILYEQCTRKTKITSSYSHSRFMVANNLFIIQIPLFFNSHFDRLIIPIIPPCCVECDISSSREKQIKTIMTFTNIKTQFISLTCCLFTRVSCWKGNEWQIIGEKLLQAYFYANFCCSMMNRVLDRTFWDYFAYSTSNRMLMNIHHFTEDTPSILKTRWLEKGQVHVSRWQRPWNRYQKLTRNYESNASSEVKYFMPLRAYCQYEEKITHQ